MHPAAVSLAFHPLCTEHAVFSARRPRVFGRAAPGSAVAITLAGVCVEAVANAEGQWRADFPSLPAGGPHTLTACAGDEEIEARGILLGELWLGGGQSNMAWTLAQTKDTADEIDAAQEPRLRFFTVAQASAVARPVAEPGGHWTVCAGREAAGMSAVGYFFGRRMIQETGLPFGVVISAWGGTAIAPWLPETALRGRAEYAGFIGERERELADVDQTKPEEIRPHDDPGIAAHAETWSAPAFDDAAWDRLPVPGQWQNEGWDFNGAVWYRRSVEIPADWVGRDLELALGIVDDFDRSFVNGAFVGGMGAETPNFWATPRFHRVPGALVTSTTVSIAVRVFDIWGGGGIMGNATLRRPDRPEAAPVALSGMWRARAELRLPSRKPGGAGLVPGALFNGMIAPLAETPFSGVLWYQGESDTERARLYPRLLTDLIRSWRGVFKAPELPFGIVQLANYQARESAPTDHAWAHLREAQRLVALHEPACGLAVAIDAGEADDIHPRYKKTVGERLALWALRAVYGRRDHAYSGPLFVESWYEGSGVRLRFSHAEGLRVRGDGLRGFQIAGADLSRWAWADEATIRGDTVFVRAACVPSPFAVRYAWQANPETTLENAAGLPASPFRADG